MNHHINICTFNAFNLTQLCSEPTHLNLAGKPESLLDLVLTNTPEYFHESARPMPPIGSSDHLPVVAKYQSIITKSKPATSSEYTNWLFPLKDVRKMDDAFLYDNWEHVFQPYNDIGETWTRWKLAFLKDLELFIPKSTRKSHNRTPSAPWFSKELKQLIRRKNRLFKKAHTSGNSDHCSGVAGGGVCVVSEEGRGSGGCGPGKFFSFSSPKQWGFVRFRVQERLQNRKTVAG